MRPDTACRSPVACVSRRPCRRRLGRTVLVRISRRRRKGNHENGSATAGACGRDSAMRVFIDLAGRALLGFIAAVLGLTAAAAAAQAAGKLPKTAIPTHYRIDLRPDPELLTTVGSVTIDLVVNE